MENTYFTQEGLEKLKKELENMVNVERPKLSKAIGEAIDKGDISENAEYDAAKDQQGMLEAKISAMQQKISTARIIDESNIDTSVVSLLTTIEVRDLKQKKTLVYTIVGDQEVDIKQGKISVNTPVARGLLGKKVGEKANISVPAGELEYEILDIRVW